MKYYYETHTSTSPRTFTEENDEAALKRLRAEFGEHLVGVMIVYVEVEPGQDYFRSVWAE